MKTRLAVLLWVGAHFVSHPALAATSGLNLAWNACLSEGGVSNRTFACNSNTGSHVMVASFILAADQPNFIGVEANIDIVSAAGIPPWWQFFQTSACRRTSLSVSFGFVDEPAPSCVDPWSGQATGAIATVQSFWTSPAAAGDSLHVARVRMIAAVPSITPIQLQSGVEYYCLKLTVNSVKTAGSGACDGCATPVCIVLSEIRAVQLGNVEEYLTEPATSNVITWQSTETCTSFSGTQNLTWGQILSLYK